MFIFITPHIVKNPADIDEVTKTKEKQLGKVMPEVKKELHRQTDLDHAMNLTDMGFQRMQQDRLEEAKDFFNQALEVDPKSPYALMNLGVICEREGKPAEAVKYYQKVIANKKGGNGAGATETNLQKICKERIERLKKPAQDNWPYLEKDNL